MQQSTPLLAAVRVVFVIFVIPVVFVKSAELQNIGLACDPPGLLQGSLGPEGPERTL